MPANRNPISAVSESGLEILTVLKGELRNLKKQLYGPECNSYREEALKPTEKIPKGVARRDLETQLDKIFSLVNLDFAKGSTETRAMVEERLGRQVERLMPIWFPPKALVMYSLRVEGRNRGEMLSSYDKKNNQWGYKKEQTPIAVLPVEEWPSAWRDFVVLDRMADSKSMNGYMPSDADYLLSTVHKFEVVSGKEKRKGEKKQGNGLGEKFRRSEEAESLHWRIKSGPERLWKMVLLMTGLERKPKETVEEIVDEAGIRLLCSDGKVGSYFGVVCSELHNGYSFPHLKGSVILQKLPVKDRKYDHKAAFLDSVPTKYRGFCERIMEEERRSLRLADDSILPYYVEMLSRFGRNNENVFDRNVIDTLLYPNRTFYAMYEENGYDELAYKARHEGWRTDHYTLFEWLVAKKLAPILMMGGSLSYANDIIETRMSKLGLEVKR